MKCTLNVFSALAFVSILDGFGKFTYLIGGIQLYKLSFKEGEIYEISSETRESPHASCSVTEPFEFGFMFLAPVLYVIYALLYGIFTMITVALGFRAGFSFSAGAMDLLFSSSLPAAQKIWLIIPLGIAAFLVFYFVFLFAIKKWDLKTPGREDDDLEAEKKVELASDNYTAIAAKILEGCGGKENITSIDNCVTRLRLEVKDITAVNDKVIKSAGVAGVIKPGKTSVQVIVGTKVQFVADAFSKLCE